MVSSSSLPRRSPRVIDVPRVQDSMNNVVLLIAQNLRQQIASQVIMKQVLQHRELQLEMILVAKRDRRSSMSENQKLEILEKRRKEYAIRRTRVGEATNNEYRAGPNLYLLKGKYNLGLFENLNASIKLTWLRF
ncbi:hypothetical protein MKX03_009387 [Papaver bracteatum]|nr:hypothetical protein MKX03_009387 [Papaver bracteatum]